MESSPENVNGGGSIKDACVPETHHDFMKHLYRTYFPHICISVTALWAFIEHVLLYEAEVGKSF